MKPFRAATFFGVPLFVTPGGFLLLGGIAVLLALNVYPEVYEDGSTGVHLAMAIASAVLFVFTIALHELAHCLMALRRPAQALVLLLEPRQQRLLVLTRRSPNL